MRRAPGLPLRLALRLLAVLAVTGPALWLIVFGVRVIAFDATEHRARAAAATAGEVGFSPDRSVSELEAWRDEPGFRHAARRALRAIERAERPFSLDALTNAAAVVAVSPADGWGWIDVAASAWIDPVGMAAAERALDMAHLVAPFEERQAEYRIRFTLATWAEASEEAKRRASWTIIALLRNEGRFRGEPWQRIRGGLNPAIRDDLDARLSRYDPKFLPGRGNPGGAP